MKRTTECAISLAGVEIPLAFRFSETKQLFRDYLCPATGGREPLCVEDDCWDRLRAAGVKAEPDPREEFHQLIGPVSAFLLEHGRCLYHGAAFLWHGSAWIITGPSGVGKTTQLLHWQKLFGQELGLINGDKPVLECREDQSVWVHPSPWNGKEYFSGSQSGKLAGIILLEQADCNEISRMDLRSCIMPIYCQFLYLADYENEIRAVGRMQDVLLRNVPVWKLRNRGDRDSAALTHDTLLRYLEE